MQILFTLLNKSFKKNFAEIYYFVCTERTEKDLSGSGWLQNYEIYCTYEISALKRQINHYIDLFKC